MAGGVELIVTPSRISKTAVDTCGFADRVRKMTQKSGDVIISFLRGPGSLIHLLMPSRISGEALSSSSFLKLEMLWRTIGTLRKEYS
jgi:hypothetical protein